MADRKVGRPTIYTEELANEICETIASRKDSLTSLCEEHKNWPHVSNLFVWIKKYPKFREAYARAKSEQVEVSIDYMQELMSESHHYTDDNGNKRVDVGLIRVKVDAIKWKASKLCAKTYGIKSVQEADTIELHAEIMRRQQTLDEKNDKS